MNIGHPERDQGAIHEWGDENNAKNNVTAPWREGKVWKTSIEATHPLGRAGQTVSQETFLKSSASIGAPRPLWNSISRFQKEPLVQRC